MGRTHAADTAGVDLVRAAAKKYLYVKEGLPLLPLPTKEETDATVADLVQMQKELEGG